MTGIWLGIGARGAFGSVATIVNPRTVSPAGERHVSPPGTAERLAKRWLVSTI
jgi:hypothetical protein